MTCWCIGVFEIVSTWYHSSLNSSQFRPCRERLFCLKISKLCGSNSTASKSCKTAFVRPPWMDSTAFDGLGCCDESNLQWRQADSRILFPALRLEEPHCRQFCSCHVMLQHVYWWCFCQHQMDPLESLQRLVLLCTLKYIEVSKIGVQDGSRMFQTSPYHTRSLPSDFRWVDLWAMSGLSRQRKAILLFRGSAPDHLPSLRTVRCRCAGRPKDDALGPDEVQMKCRWSAEIWRTGWRGSSICNVNLNCCKSWLYKSYTIFGQYSGGKRCDLSRSKGSPTRRKEHTPLILLPWRLRNRWNRRVERCWETRDVKLQDPASCRKLEVSSGRVLGPLGYRRQYQLISLTGLVAASGTMLWGPSVWNAVEAPNQRTTAFHTATLRDLQVEPDWDHVTRRTYPLVI